jgi:hypothetical protein
MAELTQLTVADLPIAQATDLVISEEGSHAIISGADGNAAIYAIEQDKVERELAVGEPVTDSLWVDTKVVFATAKGTVKVFEKGVQVASFTEHAGPVTGLAVHPGKTLVASVGSDKAFVFYDLETLARVARVYTDACTCFSLSFSGFLLLDIILVTNMTFSVNNLCLPPRWTPLRRRYTIRQHRGLRDKDGRGSRDFRARRASICARLLGERILVCGYRQGPSRRDYLRHPQGGPCGPCQGARCRRRCPGARLGLHRPVLGHGRAQRRHRAAVCEEQ